MPPINRQFQPSLQPASAFQRRLEQRRVIIARKQNEQAIPFVVSGDIDVSGAGETPLGVPVEFPVRFTARPTVAFSGTILAGTFSAPGSMPTVSLVASEWNTVDSAAVTLYRGATFVVVLSGPSDLVMQVHWSVTGLALRRPGGIDAAR